MPDKASQPATHFGDGNGNRDYPGMGMCCVTTKRMAWPAAHPVNKPVDSDTHVLRTHTPKHVSN